ncbi:MAG TPA: DNA primase, partial [Firmicutes bacterium]|nr:DNA primase [Bacillota bacterium]
MKARQGLPGDFLEQVRSRVDIVEVISQYLQLKKAGKNFLGLCPFHPDRHPSLNVSPERQMFYCFSCGAGGDVITFVMKREGLSFPEAVRLLARRAGVPWPERTVTPAQEERVRKRQRLLEVMAAAQEFYVGQLQSREGESARSYLERRGIDAATAARFGLGYAPAGWEVLGRALLRNGFQEQELVEAGLHIPRESGQGSYDRFRHRLMFPICDLRGEVVAFGGRALDDSTPKYLNSPETPLFQKGSCWYAIHLARGAIRRRGQALVVEGYMDALTCHQYGFDWAVASMGTSLTREQAHLLRGFCSQVVFCYDGDAAGEAATQRGLDIFRELGLGVQVVVLPPEEDPDSFLRRRPRDEFLRLLEGARPLVEYRLEKAACDLDRIEGKMAAVANMIPVLADISNEVEREEYLRLAARRLQVSEQALREELRRYRRRNKGHKEGPDRDKIAEMMESGSRPAAVRAEEILVRLMLADPRRMGQVATRVSASDFRHPVWGQIARAMFELAAESRQAWEEGQSWVGKLTDVLEDEEVLSAVARAQVQSHESADPQRELEDCLLILEDERARRRAG